MERKKWLVLLWGGILIIVIILNFYLSKKTEMKKEEPKSYEHEIIDNSKENPSMKGVQ